MDPITISLLLAAGGAAFGGGSTALANFSPEMVKRRNELEKAQKIGRLTQSGQAEAEIGVAQEKQALKGLEDRAANLLAQTGGTSGRDVANLQAGTAKAELEVMERAADRMRQAYAAEGQELEDRRAIRREKGKEAVGNAVKGAVAGAEVAGQMGGVTIQGKNYEDVDYGAVKGGIDDLAGTKVEQLGKRFAAGKIPRDKMVGLLVDRLQISGEDAAALVAALEAASAKAEE